MMTKTALKNEIVQTRDILRDEIIKALRRDMANLSPEVQELLRAEAECVKSTVEYHAAKESAQMEKAA